MTQKEQNESFINSLKEQHQKFNEEREAETKAIVEQFQKEEQERLKNEIENLKHEETLQRSHTPRNPFKTRGNDGFE